LLADTSQKRFQRDHRIITEMAFPDDVFCPVVAVLR
jgi:hypothetical protein